MSAWCPICDRDLGGAMCATHDVPTIPREMLDEPALAVTRGMILAERFHLLRPLGEGGMGEAFVADDQTEGGTCVVKLVKRDERFRLPHLRRMFQEARAVRALDDPHIVKLIAFGLDGTTRRSFLAMELARGRNLDAVLKEDGPLDELRAARIMEQVALGLAHAHERGILHRDLKPPNVMIEPTPNGELARVLDFGLAKIVSTDDDAPPMTAPGTGVGTPTYMAPEQITRSAEDFRLDLYGLGCMLFAVLTGKPPYVSRDLLEVMRMHLRAPVPQLPVTLAGGRPPSEGLVRIQNALLEKNRMDRPGSMQEVADAFAALVRGAAPKLRVTRDLPALPPKEDLETAVVPRPLDSRDAPHSATFIGAPAGVTVAEEEHLAPKRNVFVMLAVATPLVALGLTAVGVLISNISSTQQPVVSPEPSRAIEAEPIAAPMPSPAAAKRAPAMTEPITIRTRPPGARVTVDGAYAGDTPIAVARPDPGVQREVRLEKRGMKPKLVSIASDSPSSIELPLDAAPASGPPPTSPPPAKSPRKKDDVDMPLW